MGYRGKRGKQLYRNHPFKSGMHTTDDPLELGVCKNVANMDVSDSGDSGSARNSFVNGLIKYPDGDPGMTAHVIEHTSIKSKVTYICSENVVSKEDFLGDLITENAPSRPLGLSAYSVKEGSYINDKIATNINIIQTVPHSYSETDGDTFGIDMIDSLGQTVTQEVRMIGIDSQEMDPADLYHAPGGTVFVPREGYEDDCARHYNDLVNSTTLQFAYDFNTQARDKVTELMTDSDVESIELEVDPRSDSHSFDRLLAWVWINHTEASGKGRKLLQEELIKLGLAQVAYIFDNAHYLHLQQIFDAQQTAMAMNQGIWNPATIPDMVPDKTSIPPLSDTNNQESWEHKYYYSEVETTPISMNTPNDGATYYVELLQTNSYNQRTYFDIEDSYIQYENLGHRNAVVTLGRVIRDDGAKTVYYKGTLIFQLLSDGTYDIEMPSASEVNVAYALEDGFNLLDDDPFVFRDYFGADPNIGDFSFHAVLGAMIYDGAIQTDPNTGMPTGDFSGVHALSILGKSEPQLILKFYIATPPLTASPADPDIGYMQKLEYKLTDDLEWKVATDWEDVANSLGVAVDNNNSAMQFSLKEITNARTIAFKYSLAKKVGGAVDESSAIESVLPFYRISGTNVEVDSNDISKEINIKQATNLTTYYRHLVLYGEEMGNNILQFSAFDDYSYYPYPNYNLKMPDRIVHVMSHTNGIYVFTPTSIVLLHSSTDPAQMMIDTVYSSMSLSDVDKRTIVPVDDGIFFMSENQGYLLKPNIYSTDPTQIYVKPVTGGINNILENPRSLLTYKMDSIYEQTDIEVAGSTFDVTANVVAKANNKNIFIYTSYEVTEHLPYLDEEGNKAYDLRKSAIMLRHRYNTEQRRWTSLDTIAGTHPMIINNSTMLMKNFTYAKTNVMTFAEFKVNIGVGDLIHIADLRPLTNTPFGIDKASKIGYNELTVLPVWCFLDSGKLDIERFNGKRFKELQLDFNNLDKVGLPLMFEFLVDGETRITFKQSEVIHDTDPGSEFYGYVRTDNKIEPNIIHDQGGITQFGQWQLDYSKFPSTGQAKLKLNLSGKGYIPQFVLAIPAHTRFAISSYVVVYKEKSAR